MNVLSCFDGMACGRIALDRADIPVTSYYASEIDKYAIQVSKANWPDIIHIGDVTKVSYKNGILYTEFGNYNVGRIDLLIAGSPCQGFSFAGKQLNFNDPRSKLFFEFVRILKEIQAGNPACFFFLENVVMKKEYQQVISQELGVSPILINSALVSAQNRKRLYWTNIPFFGQPVDKNILLKDIVELDIDRILSEKEFLYMQRSSEKWSNGKKRLDIYENDLEGKALCLTANGYKGVPYGVVKKPELFLTVKQVERGFFQAEAKVWHTGNKMGKMDFPNNPDKKAKTLCSVQTAGGRETNHILTGKFYRRLTVIEWERLQTVKDNYTNSISNSQAYRVLGNGWNVDTIVHLFEPLKYADIL